jgi:hypothetical protein
MQLLQLGTGQPLVTARIYAGYIVLVGGFVNIYLLSYPAKIYIAKI